LATVTVQIEYRTPDALEAIESDEGIGDAFASGWDAFVGGVFALAYVLAISAPFLITALVIAGLAWIVGRRWSRHRAESNEQRRVEADRQGPVGPPATAPYPTGGPMVPAAPAPPPPISAERRDSESGVASGTADSIDDASIATITDYDDPTPEE
jgi:hypothetical protein